MLSPSESPIIRGHTTEQYQRNELPRPTQHQLLLEHLHPKLQKTNFQTGRNQAQSVKPMVHFDQALAFQGSRFNHATQHHWDNSTFQLTLASFQLNSQELVAIGNDHFAFELD